MANEYRIVVIDDNVKVVERIKYEFNEIAQQLNRELVIKHLVNCNKTEDIDIIRSFQPGLIILDLFIASKKMSLGILRLIASTDISDIPIVILSNELRYYSEDDKEVLRKKLCVSGVFYKYPPIVNLLAHYSEEKG